MQRGDKGELVKTVVWVDYTKADGTKLHTVYGYDPAKGGWFVDFINPKTGKTETQSFPKGPWADKNYDKLLETHGAMGAPPHLRPEDFADLDIKSPRVPKPESYTDIDPAKLPKDYKVKDVYDNGIEPTTGQPIPDADGTITLRTEVIGPKGETGSVSRSYNPRTRELKLVDSQLDRLPRDIPATGTAMVEGRGYPRWAYFSMRQMRILGVNPGAPAKVIASEVLHVKTLIALHLATGGNASRAGDPAKATGDVLAKTPMYHMTNQQLLAAGTEIKSAKIEDGSVTTIGSIMKTWEDGTPAGAARKQLIDDHNDMLKKAGMTRLTPVLQNFHIVLETVPIGTLAKGGGGTTGTP
jgi:hypothetical protein